MARERGTSAQPWGTLEELLLVCAVNRHGTQSWDSVALEVGSRCSPTATTLLSADNCRDKFEDLKRRFVFGDDDDGLSGSLGAMVDEMRRLRVEELRREVRRRDVSIVSLELKVKRLVEERERSLKEDAGANRPSKDLKRRGEDQRDGSPENVAGKMNSGEDFGSDFNSDERENRSFNESNSTSQRGDAKGNGAAEKLAEGEQEEEPRTDGNEPDPIRAKIRSEPDRDCSVNGKVADDDDDDNRNNNKKGCDDTAKACRLGESSELWESGGESKQEGKRGGGGAAASRQQNSDVQSSASLSKRKRRRGRGGEGGGGSRSRSSSGEEAEGDEVSPATSKGVKQLKLIKSEPLMKVLKIIRSHRLGSVFERRLRSQESEGYKSLIRQHMDLHVIQSKLNKGLYAEDCIPMFFRDVLLLFNNAVVFFRKNSPEHNAAQELRSIVLKEMNDLLPNPQPAIGTVTSNVPKIETKAPKIEPDVSEKPTKSSIVVCGKRGSVNALSEGGAKSRKGDKVEEKAKAANEKKTDGVASVKVEDKGIRRRRTQERRGRRGTSTRGRSAAKPTKPHEYGVNELSSHDGLEALEAEKGKKENRRKKQGAARFLKRMKQNSPSTEVKKETSDGSEDDREESEDEKKKKKKKPMTRGRKKPEVGRNERVTRSSTGSGGGRGGGRCQESNGRGRRGVGRPPKRPETTAAEAGSRKRGRENGEADQVGSAGRRRKRTRR